MNKRDGFVTEGAGMQSKNSRDEEDEAEASSAAKKPQVTSGEAIPAIATKTVKAKDVYQAASQHNNFGVELQPLTQPLLNKDATEPKEISEQPDVHT